jgi:hypothetical protein
MKPLGEPELIYVWDYELYPLLQLVVVFSAPLLLTFPSWLAVMYLGIFYFIARPR